MAQQVKFRVEGMSCDGCVRAVTNIISKNLDIDKGAIDVDLEHGQAAFDADADEQELLRLRNTLTEKGYKATSLEMGTSDAAL